MAVMSASLEYPQKHLISADEYLRMGEGSVFAPDARLELIEGEIIEMAPIDPPHAGCVNTLIQLLARRAGDKALLSVQNPLIVSLRSVPEPDFVLLKPRPDNYRTAHPTASDVVLAIEVSDTALTFDLRTKVPLYARCGIPEAWVVDVNERVIHVFRDPSAAGYRISLTLKPGETAVCAALPEARIEVGELFGA
jgi:Uma2 family endonuclease